MRDRGECVEAGSREGLASQLNVFFCSPCFLSSKRFCCYPSIACDLRLGLSLNLIQVLRHNQCVHIAHKDAKDPWSNAKWSNCKLHDRQGLQKASFANGDLCFCLEINSDDFRCARAHTHTQCYAHASILLCTHSIIINR